MARCTFSPTCPADDGVSEVVGFLLTFGIIAGILVVAMLGFNDAQADAERRVAEQQATSIAQRVAGVVVDVALFAERNLNTSNVSILLELPTSLQRNGYTVRLLGSNVTVESALVQPPARQSIFAAANQFGQLDSAASGGNLYVNYCSLTGPRAGLHIANTPCFP